LPFAFSFCDYFCVFLTYLYLFLLIFKALTIVRTLIFYIFLYILHICVTCLSSVHTDGNGDGSYDTSVTGFAFVIGSTGAAEIYSSHGDVVSLYLTEV
jgi:hypothetical protein